MTNGGLGEQLLHTSRAIEAPCGELSLTGASQAEGLCVRVRVRERAWVVQTYVHTCSLAYFHYLPS